MCIAHKRISVPPISVISDPKKRTKYLVARECIIEHLRTYTKHQHFERSIFKFSNPTDAEFDEYLHRQRPYFIMCHDHGSSSPPMAAQKVIAASAAEKKRAGEDSTLLLSFIWYVMEKGYSVGLTNEVEFLDSKVWTFSSDTLRIAGELLLILLEILDSHMRSHSSSH